MTSELIRSFRRAIRLALYRGKNFECNICGFKARTFKADPWHTGSVCPCCFSQVRHRLLVAILDGVPAVSFARLVDGRRVLHFAPENVIRDRIRSRAASYVAADLLTEGYTYALDVVADICRMESVADGSIDTLIACDVLEHVPDDRAAMAEIHRVLASGGTAILTVPQKDGLEVTDEDPSVTDPADRLKRFGQFDHVRIYGADFGSRLREAGFEVAVYDHSAFPAADVARHVLFPPVRSTHPLATNHRRVYFARRA